MATVVAGKYELLEVLRDSGIRTWRARQITLGHMLMVHFIPGSQGGDDLAVLDRLAQLPESARKQFFDAGEHDSIPYLVSWPLPEFDSLPSWLDRTIAKNRQQSKPAAPPPKTQSGNPSEFTRMFFKGMKEPDAGGSGEPGRASNAGGAGDLGWAGGLGGAGDLVTGHLQPGVPQNAHRLTPSPIGQPLLLPPFCRCPGSLEPLSVIYLCVEGSG
jgi:hypothetical protein